MPFAYYGAKHGLARRYPPPAGATIIEPFAGSAGYACHWATPAHRVVLVEKDPAVVALWREVQALTPEALRAIDAELLRDRVSHPLLCALFGGSGLNASLDGKDQARTLRGLTDWPAVRRRIVRLLPLVRRWTVIEGDYHDAPDCWASWFIDPPYCPGKHEAGANYRYGAEGLDYVELADWCRSRRGQVIVCEQESADWLPFRPLARQQSYVTRGAASGERIEMVWTRTAGTTLARMSRETG